MAREDAHAPRHIRPGTIGCVEISAVGSDRAASLYPIFLDATPHHPDAPDRGFLLSGYSESDFEAFLERSTVYGAFASAAFVGFVVVEAVAFERLDSITWHLSTEELRILEAMDLVWIRMLAVLPQVARRGIGTALYHRLYQEYESTGLLTGLYEHPLDNRASRRFHLQLGFSRIGESRLRRDGEPMVWRTGIYYRLA